MGAEVVIYRRNEELFPFPLRSARTTVIGRHPDCDLQLPDPEVSRRQCSLQRVDGQWVLTDLSGRGTDVGGVLVKTVVLKDGIDIGFGKLRAVFNATSTARYEEVATFRRPAHVTATLPLDPSLPSRPAPSTLVIGGASGERRVNLTADPIWIGTGPEADVRVEDPGVSARHCQLTPAPGGTHVLDSGSKNGTFYSGARLIDLVVPYGAPIHIGSTELRVDRDNSEDDERFGSIVGNDPLMLEVQRVIDRAAPTDCSVLIMGESGTGKELVAGAIHAASRRSAGPFVVVHCGALSANLVESELFGHEKGAFTGADREHKGAFEQADGGTIFLDELGEMSLELQVKLLRVLQDGKQKRVGGSEERELSVRVIAATNVHLPTAVRKGLFREDLFFRLAVVPLLLPPLRARKSDLRKLIEHFRVRHGDAREAATFTEAAMKKLLEHHWPGNVRELSNIISRSIILKRGFAVEAEDIRFDADLFAVGPDAAPDMSGTLQWEGKTLDQLESEIIGLAFDRCGGKIKVICRMLDVSRTLVYKWRSTHRGGKAKGDDEEEDE